jgi:multidrug transporter EmrE-like cation transporter
MILPIIVVFFNCLLGAMAASLLKKGKSKINFDTMFGLVIYGLSAVIFVYALKFAPVSVLYPITSATYIWSFIIARKYFNENISRNKLIGLMIIILGIIVLSIS